MSDFTLRLAGLTLPCRARYDETIQYFRAFAPEDAVSPVPAKPPRSPQAIGEGDRAAVEGSPAPPLPRHSERSDTRRACLVQESASPSVPPQAFPLEGNVPYMGRRCPSAHTGAEEVAPGAAAPSKKDAPLPPPSPAAPPSVHIPEADWAEYLDDGMEDCAHTEYSMLTPYFSDALLAHDRVIMHAVAIRHRDKAYLICAASGTGKSTQARTLQELRPGEFAVICGDRPILEFRPVAAPSGRHASPSLPQGNLPVANPAAPTPAEEWSVIIHPSPWNGKENWHGAQAAPLAGLILLERGEENALAVLSDREAALPVYPHFIQTAWEPDNIRKIAELETRLLRSVPIWRLTTNQVPDSTKLLLEAVF